MWRRLLLTVGVAGAGLTGAATEVGFDPDRARINYMLNCQGCHLPAGEGVQGAVPRMKGYVGNFLRVPGGREFLVRVPGSANSAIDDAQLAELLNWMLVTMSPGELPEPWQRFSAEEVGVLRRSPLREVEAVRAELVQRIERSVGRP